MVKNKKMTQKEFDSIPTNSIVIVSYHSPSNCIVLWNTNPSEKLQFNSPYITINRSSSNGSGNFRFNDDCIFNRFATKEEIEIFKEYITNHEYLNKNEKIRYLNLINKESIHELW